jgi:glycosyltransferase involved in cell wall biosynthesis
VPAPGTHVDVVIPAFNEEASIGLVLRDLARVAPRRVVVVDNACTDATAEIARAAGAEVVVEPRRGYGSACLAGVAHLRATGPPDVLAFVDADYSDHPDELTAVVAPILAGEAELVIGSRVLGDREPGALLPQARFGNWLATRMIRILHGARFTDLGPFRAIEWAAYERLGMRDRDFGWTVEMQVRAARFGLRSVEVPVRYRRRLGVSKITGTVSGTLRAGAKILYTILRHTGGSSP